jgi:hypothetical protein
MSLSIVCSYAECRYAEWCYAECQNAECQNAECQNAECQNAEYHYACPDFLNVTLGVFMQNVVMQFVLDPNAAATYVYLTLVLKK